MIQQTFAILGSLGIFFFGMKVMSDALLAVKGNRMREAVRFLAGNRVGGVFTGFLITTVIQSSGATTVMVVSFVNAGLMKLREAVGLIMGANLGTSVSFWGLAILGFHFQLTSFIFPVISLGIPLIFMKEIRYKKWGEALIGFGLLFYGLELLKQSVPDIGAHPEALAFIQQLTGYGFGSYLLFILIGILVTIIVQSSHASGAITLTMAYKGWIDFPTACAIVQGENIGTTIVAYLASLGANVHAKRAARAHFLFNVIGVLWMMVVFYPFLEFLDWLIPGPVADLNNIPMHLSAFHTLFNLCTIFLLIGFVPQVARLAERMVPDPEESPTAQPKAAPQANGIHPAIHKADEKIQRMADVVEEMFTRFQKAIFDPKAKPKKELKAISYQEYLTDWMEEEITKSLIEVARKDLKPEEAMRAMSGIRMADELENMADVIYQTLFLIQHKRKDGTALPSEAKAELAKLCQPVAAILAFLKEQVRHHHRLAPDKKAELRALLDQVKATYEELKQESTQRLQAQGSFTSELFFRDLIKNLKQIQVSAEIVLQAHKPIELERESS